MNTTNAHKNRDKMVSILKQASEKTLSDYPVIAAYLFGSQARGIVQPDSDIDIALYMAHGSKLTINDELSLGRRIEEISGLNGIDLRIINDMPLTMQGEILSRGVLLYCIDDAERIRYETKTLLLYFDYLPYIERFRNDFLDSVKKQGIL